MMKHAGARFMFCVDEYMGINFIDILDEIKPELLEVETVIIRGRNVPKWARSFDEVFDLGQRVDLAGLRTEFPVAKDIASIFYTSGSTGMPKGVPQSHYSLIWASTRVCEGLQIGPDDVFLMMLPSSFIFASFVLFTNAMMGRSKIVMMENFDAGEALRLQEAERVSVLYGVPTMFTVMLNHPDLEKYNLSSNRTGYMSGAYCPPELVQEVINKMHCNISAIYGMTESCGAITMPRYDDDYYIKSTTLGHPIRGLDLKIVDNVGNRVGTGEIGEVVIRGESLFSSYYKKPELSKDSFDSEGFFFTGDLGKLDENGRLVLVGRKKEMIIHGGFNVYPSEVEEQINLIKGVQFVAVVGIPESKMGEKICACIVPVQGYKLNPEKIIAHCKTNLATYKVPDFVEIMDSLPMTTTGKIQKYEVKNMMMEKMGKSKTKII